MTQESDRVPDGHFAARTADDAITFHRTIDAPIERVWSLLTTREGLAQWMGAAVVEPRAGGEFTAQLTEDVTMRGRILTFEPPHRLVLAWSEYYEGAKTEHGTSGDGTSELSFALEPFARGTRLTMQHRLIAAGDEMNGFGAGWHAYLDAFTAACEGRPDPETSFAELLPEYQRRLIAVVP